MTIVNLGIKRRQTHIKINVLYMLLMKVDLNIKVMSKICCSREKGTRDTVPYSVILMATLISEESCFLIVKISLY